MQVMMNQASLADDILSGGACVSVQASMHLCVCSFFGKEVWGCTLHWLGSTVVRDWQSNQMHFCSLTMLLFSAVLTRAARCPPSPI